MRNYLFTLVGFTSLVLGLSDSCNADNKPELVQAGFMERAELDLKIAQAIKLEEPTNKIRTLIGLIRFSYPVTTAELHNSDESKSFTEYVPAVPALLSAKLDTKLVASEAIDVLVVSNDVYYQRRLVYVIEKINKKPIFKYESEKIPADKLDDISDLSSFDKLLSLDFFLEAKLLPEEQRVNDLLKRLKDLKDKQNR